MATLAPASSEFVDALRRGLEAYDAGDIERASRLFDEALEIEPDNVWGLLWKGATSASVGESKMWLEQAIAIEPGNEHARAGLRWANEQLAGGAEDTRTLPIFTPDATVEAVEEMTMWGEEDSAPAAEEELDWLTGDQTTSAAELEEFTSFLQAGDESADSGLAERSESVSEEAGLPDWLSDGSDAPPETLDEAVAEQTLATDWSADAETSDEDADVLPDWLGEDVPADTLTSQLEEELLAESDDSTDLPDWLSSDAAPAATLESDIVTAPEVDDSPFTLGSDDGATWDADDSAVETLPAEADLSQPADLPDWLADDVPSSAAATELPDWLTMEDAPPAPSTDDERSDAQPEESGLPDWLLGQESAPDEPTAQPAADLPDWLTGEAPATTVPEAAGETLPDWLTGGESAAPAPASDLPDWLTGDSAASSGDALPDWLVGEQSATAEADTDNGAVGELPAWLLGDDSTPFQATRGQGSLAPSDEVVEAYQAGLWAYEEDRLDDATRAFQRVIRLDPTHVEAHNYLGSVFYLNGRQDDAIIALRRALELDANHSESYLNLGLVYKETGRNTQAVQMFSRYLDLAPADDTTTEYVRDMIGELGG